MDYLALVVPVLATAISGVFAWRARKSSAAAEELRRREEQVSIDRRDAYLALLLEMGNMLSSRSGAKGANTSKLEVAIRDAQSRLPLFASDGVLVAFSRFMQASFNEPTPPILMRLYGDFFVAVRRDLGYPDTTVSGGDILSLRITDYYKTIAPFMDPPFEQLCIEQGWTPPWPAERPVAKRTGR